MRKLLELIYDNQVKESIERFDFLSFEEQGIFFEENFEEYLVLQSWKGNKKAIKKLKELI